jgi:hypothetical protein
MLTFCHLVFALLFFVKFGYGYSVGGGGSSTKNDYLKHLMNIKLNRVERIIKRSQDLIHVDNKATGPVFKPKQVEPVTPDEDYGEVLDEYYDYYNEELPETFEKVPDYRVTTSSPKWITKNSSVPSKVYLKTLFDFVEIILRPTGPSENTVESANRLLKQPVNSEENILASPLNEDGFWENDLDG